MPTNKDFKRVVRARMTKTGESYTAARAQLLKKPPTPTVTSPSRARNAGRRPTATSTLPAEYAQIAGMSDAAVKAKTGCAWPRWVKSLDYHGAASLSHREIAALIRETYRLDSWWAQMVTVGYERIRGLREIGQRRDGHFEVNKTKTIPVSVAVLRRACASARVRSHWLPDTSLTVGKTARRNSIRWRWSDGTGVQLFFVAKGTEKSQITVQHTKLPDKDAAARMKVFWGERLQALARYLVSAR
jgi:hypothetical protein